MITMLCVFLALGLVLFLALVEIWKWLTYVFQHYLRHNGSEVEAVYLYRAYELRPVDLLETLMDELADGLGQRLSIGSARQSFPVNRD